MTTEGRTGSPWTLAEVEAAVAAYFQMLRLQEMGQNPSKATHNRALQRLLPARNISAIQRKHGNITSVLNLYGVQGLSGYKPLPNFQKLLVDVIGKELQRDETLNIVASRNVETPAELPPMENFSNFLVQPPKIRNEVSKNRAEWIQGKSIKRDYLEREARNRSLGLAGELLVMKFEAERLRSLGANSLAEKLKHVAREDGDGAGYDILSYEDDGSERFIEVKTTAYIAETPFYLSANEVEFSKRKTNQFHLYRIFSFRKQPRMFILPGAVNESCSLRPISYQAVPNARTD